MRFGRASESDNMYEIEYFAESEVFKVQKYEASNCDVGRVIDFYVSLHQCGWRFRLLRGVRERNCEGG